MDWASWQLGQEGQAGPWGPTAKQGPHVTPGPCRPYGIYPASPQGLRFRDPRQSGQWRRCSAELDPTPWKSPQTRPHRVGAR